MKFGFVLLLIFLSILNAGAETQDFNFSGYEEHIIELYESGKETEIHNIYLDINVEKLIGFIIEIEFQDYDAISLEIINETGIYNYTKIAGSVRMSITPPIFTDNRTDPCGLGPCIARGTYNLSDLGLHAIYDSQITIEFAHVFPAIMVAIYFRKCKYNRY